ncbi:MAG TPA: sigma 54-interacting transcriptional regulator [Kofleriaceae bacterium]|nr:sigma 54-interacting transcriptional regulator [Kofleriaceae bacterium]
MPSLRVQIPGKSAIVYHFYKKITSLGSAPENDVVLPDPLVPQSLAHIHFDGQTYNLATVSRKSDVTINGKKRKKHRLSHEDKLTVGAIDLTFSLIDDAPTADTEAAETVADIDGYQKLYEFSARLMDKHDLNDLLDALMDTVIELTSADKGFLLLLDGDDVTVTAARNLKRENIADAISQLSDSIVAKVVRTRAPVIISDAMNDDELANAKSVLKLRLTSVICVPLLARGKLLGLIYVGNDSVVDLFAESTMRVLTVFAAQAALIIANAILMNDLRLESQALSRRLEEVRFGEIVGTSRAMQEVFRKVEKVAATDISVLITGETGTGKELIAREIHRRSDRRERPFVTINCGAIPENLLESELFGHVKGSFTGAVKTKLGKFQVADGGTLFLDEIGEMPFALQVKLLRALQERVVAKVGSTAPETVDIRILAATNRDLEAEIKAGTFREDLYYRLNVVDLHLPALRDRGEDVLVIARYLMSRYTRELSAKARGFSPNATIAIRKHNWPGNIRELENRIKKALILADSPVLGADDLELLADNLPEILPLSEAKDRFQRDYINEILAINNGNRTKTARDLGVDPRTVFRHLEKEDAGRSE